MTWCVYQIDSSVVPIKGDRCWGYRNAPFLFHWKEIGHSISLVYICGSWFVMIPKERKYHRYHHQGTSYMFSCTSIIQHALTSRGLTRIHMGNDPYVSDSWWIYEEPSQICSVWRSMIFICRNLWYLSTASGSWAARSRNCAQSTSTQAECAREPFLSKCLSQCLILLFYTCFIILEGKYLKPPNFQYVE